MLAALLLNLEQPITPPQQPEFGGGGVVRRTKGRPLDIKFGDIPKKKVEPKKEIYSEDEEICLLLMMIH